MSALVTGTTIAGQLNAKYERLRTSAKALPAAATVVLYPRERHRCEAPATAEAGIIKPTLVGAVAKIKSTAEK